VRPLGRSLCFTGRFNRLPASFPLLGSARMPNLLAGLVLASLSLSLYSRTDTRRPQQNNAVINGVIFTAVTGTSCR
jgi:hypothetical protein